MNLSVVYLAPTCNTGILGCRAPSETWLDMYDGGVSHVDLAGIWSLDQHETGKRRLEAMFQHFSCEEARSVEYTGEHGQQMGIGDM